jgi:hypothetical protein
VLLAARVFAPALIDAVTVVVAPAASVPLAADKVTHVCVFDAVQLIEAVPVFVSVYAWLDGVNGPPNVPVEVMPPAGDTDSGPATDAAVTVKALVETLTSPWIPLVLAGAESYEFPNQAAVKV